MSTLPHILSGIPAKELNGIEGQSPLQLVLDRVRLHAKKRSLWLRAIWRNQEADPDTPSTIHAVVDKIIDAEDNWQAEQLWESSNADAKHLNRLIGDCNKAIREDANSPLSFIAQMFALNQTEVDLLQTCLAAALDPRLKKVFAYLNDQNGDGFMDRELVEKLFGYSPADQGQLLANLEIWKFILPSPSGKGFEVHPWVLAWFQGRKILAPQLVGRVKFPSLQDPLTSWPVEDTLELLRQQLSQPNRRIRLIVQGAEGSGRRTFALHLAQKLGLALLVLNVDGIPAEDWEQIFILAQRQGYVDHAALGWIGDDLLEKEWPNSVSPFPLQFLFTDQEKPVRAAEGLIDFTIQLPSPSIGERRQLWESLVPSFSGWSKEMQDHLVYRYRTPVGQVCLVRDKGADSPEAAMEVLRSTTRYDLGKLAQLLPCPFTWEDLSLSSYLKESLQDFVFEAQERELWWEDSKAGRLFPQGKGLMALFAGPPGTGKTMTAQVIAAGMELDLFRIDLSSVVSKYVGETSKHIEKVLRKAEQMHAVLLFDEADTLFGKRTDIKDAHDRYANADTNYLLQAIENYPGLAILATNRKSNIDSAFIRRLRFVYDFPRPDESQRLLLWTRLLSEMIEPDFSERHQNALQQIASLVDITGAQIKYAVLSAVFVARKQGLDLNIAHILVGIDRELIKEGRGLSPETRRRLNQMAL